MCGRAAGPSNMPIPIIPISTIPPWWSWPWTAAAAKGGEDYRTAIARGREWVEGLQSRNGGWGAFDADNDHDYLNYIPFADHGALLDPPTADVTGRCLGMLAQLGETQGQPGASLRAIAYLLRTQMTDGSWYGRWGMNYIYGTWSVLARAQRRGRRSAIARDPPRRRLAGRGSRIRTAAGARMATATSSATRAMSRRPAPPPRPPGRCSP